MTEELILELKKMAQRICWSECDDFNPCDYSGGSYDDAYYGGSDDGKTYLARKILHALGISYEQE